MNVHATIMHINFTRDFLMQAHKNCTIMSLPYEGFKNMCAYQANIHPETLDTAPEVQTALMQAWGEYCKEVI